MSFMRALAALTLLTVLPVVPAAAEPVVPAAHDDLRGLLDDLAGRLHDLGERWGSHFVPGARWPERPLVSFMLEHRRELDLSPAQVEALEGLRSEFQREAIRRDADLRIAEMDLAALLQADVVDIGRAEAKVREIERARADLRFARIRTIEQGRARLTPEQRERLRALLADPGRGARPRPPAPSRM